MILQKIVIYVLSLFKFKNTAFKFINAIIIIQSDNFPVINERIKDKIYLLRKLTMSKFLLIKDYET